MRIMPTHYTIRSERLKSWVIEGSTDQINWTEIDRQNANENLNADHSVATFPVANAVECCFIRLTQAGKNRLGNDQLVIWAFEIFGTLFE
jgi:hypothetical protein